MYYKVENIITPNQRHKLLDVYRSLDPELAHQDYNLFDVDKRHPSKEQAQMDCFSALDNYAKDYEKSFRHYFLNYGPESFTKFHTDDDDKVGLTIVTFLDTLDKNTRALMYFNETLDSSKTCKITKQKYSCRRVTLQGPVIDNSNM